MKISPFSWLLVLLSFIASPALSFSSATPPSTTGSPSATTTGSTSDCMTVADSSHNGADHEPQSLLALVQERFPTVQSVNVLATIEQSSAIGYKLQLEYGNHTSITNESSATNNEQPSHLFLKHVVAGRYVAKRRDWADLRRNLLYARTEARFYDEVVPLLLSSSSSKEEHNILPTVYRATYVLEDWIPEDETGHLHQACPNVVKEDLPLPMQKGGCLLLECLSEHEYYQASPLTLSQAQQTLNAVAQLHAAAWNEARILQPASTRLSKYSFALSMRNPKELAGIVSAWDHFAAEFATELKDPLQHLPNGDHLHLGRRVQKVANYVADYLQDVGTPDHPFATLVHGDYKSMNVFLPCNDNDAAVLVDFASVGVGVGVVDVAMHIRHAVVPELLDGENHQGEEALVRHYWERLHHHLGNNSKDMASSYTWDICWKHYQYAVVDYFRFFLGRFWKSATHASMEKLAYNENTNLINRSVPAAMAFCKRVEQYLTVVEQDYENQQQQANGIQ